jgi:hypothetical protein
MEIANLFRGVISEVVGEDMAQNEFVMIESTEKFVGLWTAIRKRVLSQFSKYVLQEKFLISEFLFAF